MNLLIIPSEFITDYKSKYFQIFKSVSKSFFNKKSIKEILSHFNSAEHYNYSHLSIVNGFHKTFILGNYYNNYTRKSIPEFTRYPSSHNIPQTKPINFEDVISNIGKFDCILIGIRSGKHGKKILDLAKKKNIFVCLLDYFDHKEVYNLKNLKIKNFITRGYEYKKDFQIYFKHDIPINESSEYIAPICPMPINPQNYLIQNVEFDKRKYSIGFSGRAHKEIHDERTVLINFLKNNFEKINISTLSPFEKIAFKDYCQLLNYSKIGFSPSGKVWDSTRHAEIGIFNCVPFLPKPNCKLVDGFIVDNDNSINYELSPDSENLLNETSKGFLKEKISKVLRDSDYYNFLSSNWRSNILKCNTLEERAKYILKKIKVFI